MKPRTVVLFVAAVVAAAIVDDLFRSWRAAHNPPSGSTGTGAAGSGSGGGGGGGF